MSDFITRLAQRQLGEISTVEPRLPELFAPVTAPEPVPLISEATTIVADEPRITTTRMHAAGKNPARVREPPILARREEEPEPVASGARASAARSTAAPTPPDALNRSVAEAAPPPRATANAREPRVELSVAAPSEIKQADSLSAQHQRRMPEGVLTRPAPQLLVEIRSPKPASAPPRLEAKMSNRVDVSARKDTASDAEPAVQVTIGRIEVTAVTQATPAKRAPAPRKPAMSLDDYLARRQRSET